MVDPRTILFSMPTITDDAPPLTQFEGVPGDTDLDMHEDEWRQLEFFSADQRPLLERTLTEFKAFEAANRMQSGWRQIFLRRLPPALVLHGADASNALSDLLYAQPAPGPIIYPGANPIQGRVQNGFSVRLGAGAALYGYRNETGVPVLGAHLQNADDRLLTNAFTTLYRSHGLLLVDWRAQMLVLSVEANGQIGIWTP